jgi:hypothetical protein
MAPRAPSRGSVGGSCGIGHWSGPHYRGPHGPSGQEWHHLHGGVDPVAGDALDRVGRRLDDTSSSARTALGDDSARGSAPCGRWAACPRRCAPGRSRSCGGATAGSAARCGRPTPAHLDPHRARCQVELVVHDDDGGRIVDPEPLGQTAHGQSRLVHVGGRDGQRHLRLPEVTERARACTPFSARSEAPCLWPQKLDGIGAHVVQRPANSAPGFPSPTTSRSAAVPRRSDRGKDAAQGLALVAGVFRPPRRRPPPPPRPLRPLRLPPRA